jgi:hypothetical protein
MSAPSLPKRRLVDEVKKELFEMKVNALSDAGYTMEHFAFGVPSGDSSYEYSNRYIAVMKIKEDPSIQLVGMLDIMDIPISKAEEGRPFGSPLVQKAVAEGWVGGSLYSGKVTMVRRKKE